MAASWISKHWEQLFLFQSLAQQQWNLLPSFRNKVLPYPQASYQKQSSWFLDQCLCKHQYGEQPFYFWLFAWRTVRPCLPKKRCSLAAAAEWVSDQNQFSELPIPQQDKCWKISRGGTCWASVTHYSPGSDLTKRSVEYFLCSPLHVLTYRVAHTHTRLLLRSLFIWFLFHPSRKQALGGLQH